MKKLSYILLSLFCVNTLSVLAQNSNFNVSGSGKISNFGTINFKKAAVVTNLGQISNSFTVNSNNSNTIVGKINLEDQSILHSNSGTIDNEGIIHTIGNGNLEFSQPNINGDVIFENGVNDPKSIQQASYFNIKFLGDGNKNLMQDKPLVSRNHFYSDGVAPLRWDPSLTNTKIIIKDSLDFSGNINPYDISGQILMNGIKGQNLRGNGRTFLLELDNSLGANVQDTSSDKSKKDGLKVAHLVLTKGQLRNSVDANISIDVSSSTMSGTTSGTITRTALGSLAYEPKYTSNVTLRYIGTAGETNIVSGAEVPKIDNTKLENLLVENVDGVTLGNSATVSNRVFVNSTLRTYQKGINGKDSIASELLMTSQNDPEYANSYAEVDGKLTRNNLKYDGSPILFNNRYTYAKFNDVASAGQIKKLSFDIRMATAYDTVPYRGFEHIQRTFAMSADTSNEGNTSTTFNASGKVSVRFAWRNDNNDKSNIKANEVWADAQNPQSFTTLTFQRWTSAGQWADMTTSKNLVDSVSIKWAYIEGEIDGFNKEFGLFTVGAPANSFLKIFARAVLQGPFKTAKIKDDIMYTNLRDSNRIPLTPPNIYPYNLDSYSQFISMKSIQSNIVDWVVLELRDRDINPRYRYFKTCLLNKNGDLIDPIVGGVVALSQSSVSKAKTNIDTLAMDTTGQTAYYIAIRHRNHLSIMSQNPIQLHYDLNKASSNVVDMTRPDSVYGGASNLRLLGYNNKTAMFGLIGGNFPAAFDADGNVTDANPISDFFLAGLDGMDEVKPNDYNVVTTFFKDQKFPLGYFTEDYDLNGIVNSKDFNISWNNRDRNVSIK